METDINRQTDRGEETDKKLEDTNKQKNRDKNNIYTQKQTENKMIRGAISAEWAYCQVGYSSTNHIWTYGRTM